MHLNADGQPIWVRDARGYISTVQYNLDGLPTQVTEALGTTKERSTWYFYDLNGNLKAAAAKGGAAQRTCSTIAGMTAS